MNDAKAPGGTAIGGKLTVQSKGRVDTEMDDLSRNIDELSIRIDSLAERIAPVLGQVPPSDVKDKAQIDGQCDLAAQLASKRDRVVTLCDVVTSLADRVEL